MNTDAVIGCDAVDAGNAWLRLRTAAGAVRTIPWPAVKIAGMGGNHEGSITVRGVTEKTVPYFPTHDSVWIVYAEGGFAQAMLEKSSPKREAILATFAQQLGDRWLGDRFTAGNLTAAMFQMPLAAMKGGIPKLVTIMIAFVSALILLAIVAGYVASRHAQ
jgi:hypothetical protein